MGCFECVQRTIGNQRGLMVVGFLTGVASLAMFISSFVVPIRGSNRGDPECNFQVTSDFCTQSIIPNLSPFYAWVKKADGNSQCSADGSAFSCGFTTPYTALRTVATSFGTVVAFTMAYVGFSGRGKFTMDWMSTLSLIISFLLFSSFCVDSNATRRGNQFCADDFQYTYTDFGGSQRTVQFVTFSGTGGKTCDPKDFAGLIMGDLLTAGLFLLLFIASSAYSGSARCWARTKQFLGRRLPIMVLSILTVVLCIALIAASWTKPAYGAQEEDTNDSSCTGFKINCDGGLKEVLKPVMFSAELTQSGVSTRTCTFSCPFLKFNIDFRTTVAVFIMVEGLVFLVIGFLNKRGIGVDIASLILLVLAGCAFGVACVDADDIRKGNEFCQSDFKINGEQTIDWSNWNEKFTCLPGQFVGVFFGDLFLATSTFLLYIATSNWGVLFVLEGSRPGGQDSKSMQSSAA